MGLYTETEKSNSDMLIEVIRKIENERQEVLDKKDGQIAALSKQVGELKPYKEQYESTNTKLQDAYSRLNDKDKEVVRLTTQLETMRNEVSRLKEQLTAKTKECEIQKQQADNNLNMAIDQEREKDAVIEKFEELNNRYKKLEKTSREIYEENNRLHKKYSLNPAPKYNGNSEAADIGKAKKKNSNDKKVLNTLSYYIQQYPSNHKVSMPWMEQNTGVKKDKVYEVVNRVKNGECVNVPPAIIKWLSYPDSGFTGRG